MKKESFDEKELSKCQPQENEGPDSEGPTWQTFTSQDFKVNKKEN